MRTRGIFAAIVAVGLAGSAQAVSFFTIGATVAGADPGLATTEQAIMNFQGRDLVGYNVDYASGVSYLTGGASAPAGDTTRYMSVASGGSVLFDLRTYLNNRSFTSPAKGLSIYVGSINAGNKIEVLTENQSGSLIMDSALLTVTGSQMLGSGSSVSATNRRLYISFETVDHVSALRFSSIDGSLEFDTVGVSSASYVDPNATQQAAQLAAGGIGGASSNIMSDVPEPRSWATIVIGFGLLGALLRRRRPERSGYSWRA